MGPKALRELAEKKRQEAQAIIDKGKDDASLYTDDDFAKIEALTAEAEQLYIRAAQLERFHALSSNDAPAGRRTAATQPANPVTTPESQNSGANADRVPAVAATPLPKGTGAARIVRSLAAGRMDPQRAAHFCEHGLKDPVIAAVLSAGDGSTGGFLIPEAQSTEIIELLYPFSVVRKMGPINAPLVNGSMTIPKIATGSAADYIGENVNVGVTGPGFGQLKLTTRKLAALVPMSNDFIRFSNPRGDEVIRQDLVRAMGKREDAAFIRDNGTGNAPKGLRYWAPSANVIPANVTINLANVKNDLGKLELALLNANVAMIKPGWLMAPRTKVYLENLVDSNGNPAFPEMARGMLRNYPIATTTQIPVNLGGGSDESELYFVDFADCVIAEAQNLIIDVSSEAAYHDGSNVVAAFSLDQTVMRVIAQHDFGVRHDAAVAVLTAVKWAP